MISRPSLAARGVTLQPLGPSDLEALWYAETDPGLLLRWRHEGRVNFTSGAGAGGILTEALCAFLVISEGTEGAVGITVIHNVAHQHGVAYMSVASFDSDDAEKAQATMLGHLLNVNYAFETWNLHKLAATIPEFNFDQFHGLVAGLGAVEGRLQEHLWLSGRRWDLINYAVLRSEWEARRSVIDGLLGK